MATIIVGAMWTLTEAAGDYMVEQGLLIKCDKGHIPTLEVDKPIYHVHHKKPLWFGFTTIPGAIRDAERHVENAG
jgi:hypothetical protein